MRETKFPGYEAGTGFDDLGAAMRSLRLYYPDDFTSPEEFDRRKRELYMLGDMRVVYVNQGDWIRVQRALAADAPPAPRERSKHGTEEQNDGK